MSPTKRVEADPEPEPPVPGMATFKAINRGAQVSHNVSVAALGVGVTAVGIFVLFTGGSAFGAVLIVAGIVLCALGVRLWSRPHDQEGKR